jgi:hypothetical protein
MKTIKFALLTLVILISAGLHAATGEDCNNVLAFEPRKSPLELAPEVKLSGLEERTAQIFSLADRLQRNPTLPKIIQNDENTVRLVSERFEDLTQSASALVLGARALISHGPSGATKNTSVLNFKEQRLLVTLMPLLMELDQHILKYEPFFKHPDLLGLTEAHPHLLKLLTQTERDYALFRAITADTRMSQIAPDLHASQLNRQYRGGLFSQTEVDEEFDFPFHKRTSADYIENANQVLDADYNLLFEAIVMQLGRIAQSPVFVKLNADKATNKSMLSAVDSIAALIKRHASNLEIYSKEVEANTPNSGQYAGLRNKIWSYKFYFLTLLKSDGFKALRDKEFVIDRSLFRKYIGKSRFAEVRALIQQLETKVTK